MVGVASSLVTWKEKVGQGGRKARRARAVPGSTAGAGIALIYAPGGGGGEVTGHRKGTKQPLGVLARGSSTSASVLLGSALPPVRAKSLRSASCLAPCPPSSRAHHPKAEVACTPGHRDPSGYPLASPRWRPKPEWAYNKQTETTGTLNTTLSPRDRALGRGQKSSTSRSLKYGRVFSEPRPAQSVSGVPRSPRFSRQEKAPCRGPVSCPQLTVSPSCGAAGFCGDPDP